MEQTVPTPAREMRGQRGLWRLEPPVPAELLAGLAGYSAMLCHLVYCRGHRTAEEIHAFFTQADISHDPFLLPDMEAAVERLARAAVAGEPVAIYGDFDCDGITSTAILLDTLRGISLEPIVHLPQRDDGHGLNPEALALLADRSVSLIVTADCGITAVDEVLVARGMGMDVIITDHHLARVDGSLPDCPAVSPTRHDSLYPFRYLCGAGVVYKLAQALEQRVPGAPPAGNLLDLVALGTIADVVPLIDENRGLVIAGLERLRHTQRPGLLALFEAAGIEQSKIDPTAVGFYLAPRINAANRMASPQLALELLTATDTVRAQELARQLGEHNRARQALVAESLELLKKRLGDPDRLTEEVQRGDRAPILIELGDWPAGISGLLASKLVDLYGVPAFVGSAGEGDTVAVSARGPEGAPIDELLEGCEAALPGGLFLGYGGHARAGGFRVPADKLDLTIGLLGEQARRHVSPERLGAGLLIDAEVALQRLDLHAASRIRSLAPFGMGFSEPLFLVRQVELQRLTARGGNKHAHVTVRQAGTVISGIAFYASPALFAVSPGSALDLVFHLQINEWGGRQSPELVVRDWRLSD